jgi:hypothetical protein
MKASFTGHSFDFQVSPEQVIRAVIRQDHISIEFSEDSDRGHLEAAFDSSDGVYRGTYGYRRPNPDYRAELRLYRAANGDVVLFGKWQRFDNEPEEGYWLFRLSPDAKE